MDLDMLDANRNAALAMPGICFGARGFRGGFFCDFYVRQDSTTGPGWYIYGRNPAYGGSYIMLCARPDVPQRAHPHYNVRVRRGWHTKREAETIARELNARDVAFKPFFTNVTLYGTVFRDA